MIGKSKTVKKAQHYLDVNFIRYRNENCSLNMSYSNVLGNNRFENVQKKYI